MRSCLADAIAVQCRSFRGSVSEPATGLLTFASHFRSTRPQNLFRSHLQSRLCFAERGTCSRSPLISRLRRHRTTSATMADADLEARFKKAVWLIRNGPKIENTSNEKKLEFYSYYKQVLLAAGCRRPLGSRSNTAASAGANGLCALTRPCIVYSRLR